MHQAMTRTILERQYYEYAFLSLSLIFLVSLLYSRYVLSLSMFGFALLVLCEIRMSPRRIRLRPGIISKLCAVLDRPSWWATTLIFFIVLYGGLYSDNTEYWFSRLRLKAPFLIFPFGFYLLPSLSKSLYHKVHSLLVVVMVASSLPILIDMMSDYTQVLTGLSQGKAIDTPGSHIRYSLLLSLAFFSAVFLWQKRFTWMTKYDRTLLLIAAGYLFVFVHLLAVRSGIAVLYLTVVVLVFRSLIIGSHQKAALLAAILIVITPLAAYYGVPSFRQRIDYMVEDVTKYQTEEWNAYSDAERVLSIKAGLSIASAHPWLGVGPGDLRDCVQEYYLQHFGKDTSLLPHNQFISIAAGSGCIGAGCFILAFFIPILTDRHYEGTMVLVVYSITFFSMWVENTFETSVGVAYFAFFAYLGIRQQHESARSSETSHIALEDKTHHEAKEQST